MALKQCNEIFLPKSYSPSEVETYMNDLHLEYFRHNLFEKRDLLQNEWESLNSEIYLSADVDIDIADKAGRDVILFSNIKRLESIQKSITSIDASLDDINNKKYGYCKKTGKPIGLKRLTVNPEAKFCVEAQEDLELMNNNEE
jgi:DnaK suppressor protein